MEENGSSLFVALVLYRKAILAANGQKEPVHTTVRIIKAKDKNEAIEKLNQFWKEKMRTWKMIQGEITAVIE